MQNIASITPDKSCGFNWSGDDHACEPAIERDAEEFSFRLVVNF